MGKYNPDWAVAFKEGSTSISWQSRRAMTSLGRSSELIP
ncbi:MAG: hypothetical protein U0L19_03660 [Bacteroidales bacterium]|nr:hypothetical protein [Bacteroidales bacterium]